MLVIGLSVFADNNMLPEKRKYDFPYSEYKQAVDEIQRMCPARLWDNWVLQWIDYNHYDQSVVLAVKLGNWPNDGFDKIEYDELVYCEQYTLQELEKGYQDVIMKHEISGDGSFLIYLAIGTMIHHIQETGDNVKLCIVFLKPDSKCLISDCEPTPYSGEIIKTLLEYIDE